MVSKLFLIGWRTGCCINKGNIMSWLSNLLHPKRAYDKAAAQSQAGYNQAQGYLDPYNQSGQGANNWLTDQRNNLSNPADLQNQWAEGYEMSPYAKQLQTQAMDSGMNAAGSMGLLGSSAALGNLQQGSTNIMNADRQQYMNDLMQKYLTGIGIGTGQANNGMNAAGQMGQNSINQGNTQAGLTFGGQNAGSNMLMQLLSSLGQGGLQYLTGGMGQGGMGRGAWAPQQGSPGYGMYTPPQSYGGY